MEYLINTRKAQLKIQQMAFVLIALTLFFVMVGLFVFTISFSGLKESAKTLDEENTLVLVSQLADSPEFACEGSFDSEVNCVDYEKALILSQDPQKYRDFWGVSGVKIKSVYPDSSEIEIISVDEGTGISNFVALCKKELDSETERPYDKCGIAKIIVSYNR